MEKERDKVEVIAGMENHCDCSSTVLSQEF